MKKLVGIAMILGWLVGCSNQTPSTNQEQANVEIGILQYMEHDSLTAVREGFVEELVQAGYKDGENVTLNIKNAHGEQSSLQSISDQLLKRSNVILTIATPAAQFVANHTEETPVVFSAVTDPVSAGLVESIERPGGLVTGTSDQAPIDKQIELLKQVAPDAKTVGILYTSSERNSEVQVDVAKELLQAAGIQVVAKTVTTTNDVQDAMNSLMKDVDVVFVPTDNTIASTMTLIGELAIEHQVPVIGGSQEMVQEGGLLTYGTNYKSLGRQTAKQVIKILEGADPATMAVEYPTTLELLVNEEMAKALNIDYTKISVD